MKLIDHVGKPACRVNCVMDSWRLSIKLIDTSLSLHEIVSIHDGRAIVMPG